MAEGLAESAGTDVCSELLAATRVALTGLRADKLEDLARRAEGLVAALFPQAPHDNGEPTSSPQFTRAAAKEHRLLAELLRATDSNLQVLRRLHSPATSPKVNSQWVR